MDANTCQAILNAHDICQRWKTKLLIPHGDDIVDVSYEDTCNHNKIPAPTVGQLPRNCYYQFDTDKFRGPNAEDDVIDCIRNACIGCSIHKTHKWRHGSMVSISLRCACNRLCVNKTESLAKFEDGKFSKIDCKPKTVVQHKNRNNRAFARMGSKKMKGNKAKEVSDQRGRKK